MTTEVFEAVAPGAAERHVALKRLRPEARSDAAAQERLQREAEITALVSHANVVRLVDAGEDAVGPYIALEFVDGLSLAELGPLPVSLALHVGFEVLSALAAVHGARDAQGALAGIVHRDVKPANVLVGWNGDLRLVDFSIAARAGGARKTAVGRTHGTAGYMAPEQAAGAPVDARTDLFAVGCLVAALVTGRSPIEAQSAQEACYAGEPVGLDANIPTDVRAVLARALAFSPARRYASAEEMLEALWPVMTKAASAEPRAALRRLLEPERAAPKRPKGPGLQALFDTGVIPGGSRSPVERRRTQVAMVLDEDAEATLRAPAPPQEELLGMSIHGYRLVARIGDGSSSLVFRARHEALGIDYAVKVLRQQMATPIGIRRLEREAAALRRVDHPNVARLVDFGRLPDGRPFLTTDLQDGDSLRERIARTGPLTLQETGDLLLQIALGLEAAHAAGVVHRDLKLGNLVLGGADGTVVKIIDFGIARLTDESFEGTQLTRANALLGTRTHMAPEQIESAKDATPAVDIYGLGVCAHQLLRGAPPFLGRPDEILELHRSATPPRLKGAGELADLVDAMLAKDPAARPDAGTVARELRAMGYVVDRGETRRVLREDPTHIVPPLGATAVLPGPAPLVDAKATQNGLRMLVVGVAAGMLGVAATLVALRGADDVPVMTAPGPGSASPAASAAPSVSARVVSAAPPRTAPTEKASTPKRKAPRIPVAPDMDRAAATARVRRALLAAGISVGWARRWPAFAEPYARYRTALESADPAALESASAALARAIEAESMTQAFLQRRLADAAERLEAVAGSIDEKAAMGLEGRYFELRAAAQSGARPTLLKEVGRLITDIDAAR